MLLGLLEFSGGLFIVIGIIRTFIAFSRTPLWPLRGNVTRNAAHDEYSSGFRPVCLLYHLWSGLVILLTVHEWSMWNAIGSPMESRYRTEAYNFLHQQVRFISIAVHSHDAYMTDRFQSEAPNRVLLPRPPHAQNRSHNTYCV